VKRPPSMGGLRAASPPLRSTPPAGGEPTAPTPTRAAAPAEGVGGALALPDRPAVLLPLEAAARGFKSPLAFKRWCRRYGVPVLSTEKLLWVRPADVDAALARVAEGPTVPANDLAQLAAASVARSTHGVR
jgi:hypothetical protein